MNNCILAFYITDIALFKSYIVANSDYYPRCCNVTSLDSAYIVCHYKSVFISNAYETQLVF
jgi:hypothetical protein